MIENKNDMKSKLAKNKMFALAYFILNPSKAFIHLYDINEITNTGINTYRTGMTVNSLVIPYIMTKEAEEQLIQGLNQLIQEHESLDYTLSNMVMNFVTLRNTLADMYFGLFKEQTSQIKEKLLAKGFTQQVDSLGCKVYKKNIDNPVKNVYAPLNKLVILVQVDSKSDLRNNMKINLEVRLQQGGSLLHRSGGYWTYQMLKTCLKNTLCYDLDDEIMLLDK